MKTWPWPWPWRPMAELTLSLSVCESWPSSSWILRCWNCTCFRSPAISASFRSSPAPAPEMFSSRPMTEGDGAALRVDFCLRIWMCVSSVDTRFRSSSSCSSRNARAARISPSWCVRPADRFSGEPSGLGPAFVSEAVAMRCCSPRSSSRSASVSCSLAWMRRSWASIFLSWASSWLFFSPSARSSTLTLLLVVSPMAGAGWDGAGPMPGDVRGKPLGTWGRAPLAGGGIPSVVVRSAL
mmetsp:Transcript_16553/g.39820  ORF Transcript_16553/g.39820 Transcript_16553/m.39820 type:complete len:239 (+) Transcript_16553:313-1029(+)